MARTEEKNLTSKQLKLLLNLLSAPTISLAAKEAGIGERTAFRFLADPIFQRHYQKAKRQQVGQAISRLQQVSGEAVSTLTTIAADPKALASTRVSAARTILEMTFKATEMESLEDRLNELEMGLQKLCEERDHPSSHE
jgi:hypothetical protein